MPRFLQRATSVARYLAGHLRRRDPRVWVFGNSKGFRDNPRYLAEYLANERPDLHPWWIARSEAEAQQARSAGLSAALRASAEGVRAQSRAGVAFLSNGFGDLEPDRLGGAFVVDLRHGKGLKRALLDLDQEPAGIGLMARARRWLRRRLIGYRLGQVDMIVAPGTMAAEMYRTAYAGDPSRIRVLGTPRFDVIAGGVAFERAAGPHLRADLGLADDDYVVLWLPTWREGGDEAWLPRLESTQLEAAVAGTRMVIVVKPHPYSDAAVFRARLPQHRALRLLPEADVDANCLLRVSDALITDFSSAAFDFALLDRPIHFLVPDIDDYRDGAGLYEPLENLTAGRQYRDWESILPDVRAAALGQDSTDRDVARRIRQRGGNQDSPGSCARITVAVAAEIGLQTAAAETALPQAAAEHPSGRAAE
ncbi:MAG TPA: CDP-glycerol glycerophosphotransferase family protein [Candidatus Limnocylindria bacterium]|nr:CDP-glycerol glycerophosphotransferase family protein [Candidatus Limnocylindria bacterium]